MDRSSLRVFIHLHNSSLIRIKNQMGRGIISEAHFIPLIQHYSTEQNEQKSINILKENDKRKVNSSQLRNLLEQLHVCFFHDSDQSVIIPAKFEENIDKTVLCKEILQHFQRIKHIAG